MAIITVMSQWARWRLKSPACLLDRLFRRKSKKTSKLRVSGICGGNSPVTGEFPAQRASYAENVFIWWRHHDDIDFVISRLCIIVGMLVKWHSFYAIRFRCYEHAHTVDGWCYVDNLITEQDWWSMANYTKRCSYVNPGEEQYMHIRQRHEHAFLNDSVLLAEYSDLITVWCKGCICIFITGYRRQGIRSLIHY